MTTVAIIAEYNPFHSGHEYQIRKIREEFGEDTAIVAIMSGNFTQRGEIAFCGKATRAKCAIAGGTNLVLELPFPYSLASAEFFASAGVFIANALGNVDYLSFGSESGDIVQLEECARVLLSDEFRTEFEALAEEKIGYPERCEAAYRKICPESNVSFSSNNILALEYLKALIVSESRIKPHTVKRIGADYSEECFIEAPHQSAMAIRHRFFENAADALECVPPFCKNILEDAVADGEIPCLAKKISSAIITKLRLNPVYPDVEYHDANNGLYNRLRSASFEANDINTLLELSETKNYTKARIRRAMWSIFFGVTSSDMKTPPQYTQILAMDKIGMLLLRTARKSDDFAILTKPSDFEDFSAVQLKQKLLSDSADSVFELTKPVPKSGKSALKFTPYIKK